MCVECCGYYLGYAELGMLALEIVARLEESVLVLGVELVPHLASRGLELL